jgi:hypothetical protein
MIFYFVTFVCYAKFYFAHGVLILSLDLNSNIVTSESCLIHQKYGLVLFSVIARFNFVFMHWVCSYVFCMRTSLFGSFI